MPPGTAAAAEIVAAEIVNALAMLAEIRMDGILSSKIK
jgi:hypothetical protein